MKTLNEVKNILILNKQNLFNEFKIRQMGIFGSYAREEQTPNSDLDILVDFDVIPGLEFVDLADLLEEIVGEKVDLVSKGAIRPDRWKYVEDDIVYV